MHRLQFVGSGSAFTMANFHTNLVFWNTKRPNDRLMLDCGSDVRHSLAAAGIDQTMISGVYISHLHGDHAGGLEWLGFITHFDPRCEPPDLYISRSISGALWSNVLSGGMRSLQGEVADLETYFDVHRIGPNGGFTWDGVDFRLVQGIHIYDGFAIQPSFGLMFDVGGRTVFWTSDSQYAPEQLNDFYRPADVIFHDCETAPYESKVHAHYNKLRQLPDEVRAKMEAQR